MALNSKYTVAERQKARLIPIYNHKIDLLYKEINIFEKRIRHLFNQVEYYKMKISLVEQGLKGKYKRKMEKKEKPVESSLSWNF